MSVDVETVCKQIVRFLSDDGTIDPKVSMEALLITTATMIFILASNDPVVAAERFSELLVETITDEANTFPGELRARMVQ